MNTVLWWLRRDLRLSDNRALSAALAHGDRVVPVYILDQEWLAPAEGSQKRLAFLLGGLRRLDGDLRARGSRLIVRRGDIKEELAALLAETGASAIFAEAEYSPLAMGRDAGVAKSLPLRLYGGLTVHPPDVVKQGNGKPYTAFAPFSKAWKALPPPPVRDVLRPPEWLTPPPDVASLPIPGEPAVLSLAPFPPGEAQAQQRLQAFVDGGDGDQQECGAPIYCYDAVRNQLDVDGTAQISAYLSFGMLSARQAVLSALSAMDAASDPEAGYSAEFWLKALIRREFAISILFHYPQALEQGLRAESRNMPWENDPAAFDAWIAGRTGFPLVDAAMRQLVQTGWLHTRARKTVASFLVKDLLVDWRWGEQFFLQHLLDGDLAANNLNWQRAAGSGTGSAAYLGILNPVLEGRKYDPDGAYVRRWVPELAGVPARYIHQPWSMPSDVQRELGCVIGQDYPAPILDHGWARDRALEFFGRAREPAKSSYEKNESFIRLEGLSKGFEEGGYRRIVLQGAEASFDRGEFVAILGKSGSGKSTLLNLISGIDLVDGGDIWVSDQRLTALNERQRTLYRRQNIGFVFQFFNLIPTLTVWENVILPLELAGVDNGEAHRRVEPLLDAVGLLDRRDTFPDRLSGGEQQRVAIARALVHDPLLVLADEPTGNLDEDTGRQVMELLDRLTRQAGKNLILVTHSNEAAAYADRVLTLRDGKLVNGTEHA